MQAMEIEAIDVHAHYGRYVRDNAPPMVNAFASACAQTVLSRARRVNIDVTIVSPLLGLLPRGRADAVAGNEEAAQIVRREKGLLQWVIAHPLQKKTFQQVDQLLAQPQCVGIKIHPEEHVYPIAEQGAKLFELAARHNAIVLAHSGDEFSRPEDFVPLANAHSNVTLILAHLGNGGAAAGDPTSQVHAIQDCRHSNVFVDTSSARSITPGLIEWAVQQIGADRILFGTDSPLYSTAMQRARIDFAEINDADKRSILRENAQRLFRLATDHEEATPPYSSRLE